MGSHKAQRPRAAKAGSNGKAEVRGVENKREEGGGQPHSAEAQGTQGPKQRKDGHMGGAKSGGGTSGGQPQSAEAQGTQGRKQQRTDRRGARKKRTHAQQSRTQPGGTEKKSKTVTGTVHRTRTLPGGRPARPRQDHSPPAAVRMDMCAPGSVPSPCRLRKSRHLNERVRARRVSSPCQLHNSRRLDGRVRAPQGRPAQATQHRQRAQR